jgi:hypothetical protein
MGRQQLSGNAPEATGTTVLDAATILGNALRDLKDYKLTFQFEMGAGSCVLQGNGPGDALEDHTTGITDGNIVHTTEDEIYDEYLVTWTGTGDTGVVYWWAEARR